MRERRKKRRKNEWLGCAYVWKIRFKGKRRALDEPSTELPPLLFLLLVVSPSSSSSSSCSRNPCCSCFSFAFFFFFLAPPTQRHKHTNGAKGQTNTNLQRSMFPHRGGADPEAILAMNNCAIDLQDTQARVSPPFSCPPPVLIPGSHSLPSRSLPCVWPLTTTSVWSSCQY